MNRFSLTTIFLLLSTLCCYSQIQVLKVSDHEAQVKTNALMYYLPQSTLEITLKVTAETFVPGPYAKYAEKYLSIKNVATTPSYNVKIESVGVEHITQPDPTACFAVAGKQMSKVKFNHFGIITGYNTTSDDCEPSSVLANKCCSNGASMSHIPDFVDYGVKRNFTGNTDTTYKVVEIDSVFQKIPVYNKVIISKDEETKAEEAVNYIIKIRKRLFKIITAQFETETPPSDIKIMVEELKQLEKHYLELFVGKVVTNTMEYVFYYTPQSDLTEERVPLLYVTSENDIKMQKVDGAEPISIVLKNSPAASEVSNFYGRQELLKKKEKSCGLFYRIPSLVTLTVDYKDFTYYSGVVEVPQCGYLGHLPADIFKNKNLRVDFDAKSGAVKGMYTK